MLLVAEGEVVAVVVVGIAGVVVAMADVVEVAAVVGVGVLNEKNLKK